MDKYIVEIEGKNTCTYPDGEKCLAFHVESDSGKAVICTKIPLTPYTEPDMEQVRKEAYEKGYETAKHECEDCPKQAYTDALRMDVYLKGLSDAWEAARKVSQVREYGGYGDCLEEVFGRHRVPWDVFDYSASEAIEKIRQYEQEKEEDSRLRRSIKNVMSACDCSLDDIAEVLQKMKES